MFFMAGWKSRYDHPGQSATDKYFGRKLHVQDNFWAMAKPLLIIYVLFLIYCVIKNKLWDFSYVREFINYVK